MSWQELKDFVRNLDSAESGKKCDVIHAEVFNGKGYGWVKIRGAEDFWRAYGEIFSFAIDVLVLCIRLTVERMAEWKGFRGEAIASRLQKRLNPNPIRTEHLIL